MAQLRGRERARYVAEMFARISRRYDLMNTVMTAGRHYAWRRRACRLAVGSMSGPALDVAAGTCDFAFDLARDPSVTHVAALDFSPPMLHVAARKALRQGLAGAVDLVVGDAHALPFEDDTFICATVGFGVRNFIDRPLAVRELARVVRPGGRVAVLEIVRMDEESAWGRAFPRLFGRVAPALGAVFAGEREAYTYLPESVGGFASAPQLASLMEDAGLRLVANSRVWMRSVALLVGEKPPR